MKAKVFTVLLHVLLSSIFIFHFHFFSILTEMCPCFRYVDVVNTSSHNFDLVLTAQVHKQAGYLNTNGLLCSFIRFCIQNFNHVTCQANTISLELQAILIVLFFAFLLTLRLLK